MFVKKTLAVILLHFGGEYGIIESIEKEELSTPEETYNFEVVQSIIRITSGITVFLYIIYVILKVFYTTIFYLMNVRHMMDIQLMVGR